MEIPPYSGEQRENFYRARIISTTEFGAVSRCSVMTVTADHALLPLTRRVSFLKVDVEGAELQVVRGAQHLLRRDRPVCLIEVGSDPDQSASDGALLFGVMAELGYEPYFLRDGALHPRKAGDIQTDYLFLPST